jgi:hypothetical protein
VHNRFFWLGTTLVLSTAIHAADYTVTYTGRLFGYFRYPEVQTVHDAGCPIEPPSQNNARLAYDFQQVLAQVDPKHESLRVAVGDSFAPFFLSRLMWHPNPGNLSATHWLHKEQWEYAPHAAPMPAWLPEDQLPAPDQLALYNGGGVSPMDNVGCFLRLAQFDAVVPGQFDFMFGPQRLRELAEFANLPNTGRPDDFYRPVRMLGANITMHVQRVDPSQQSSANGQSNGAIGNLPRSATPPNGCPDLTRPKAVLPNAVLPWMRAVRIRDAISVAETTPGSFEHAVFDDATTALFRAWLASSPPPPGPCVGPSLTVKDTALPPHTFTLTLNVTASHISGHNGVMWNLEPDPNTRSKITTDLDFWTIDSPVPQPLPPDQELTLTIALPPGLPAVEQKFYVEKPFFEAPGQLPWVSRTVADKPIVTIGVVDQNLAQLIGRLNSTWMAHDLMVPGHFDDRVETDLKISDPAEALAQVLQFCYHHPACRDGRKVLLASMPQPAVYDLLMELRTAQIGASQESIDVVIAAADPSRETGNRTVTYGHDDKNPPVLVPADHTQGDLYNIRVRLEHTEITRTSDTQTTLTNQRHEAAQAVDADLHIGTPGQKDLSQWLGLPEREPIRPFLENLALEKMRSTCRSEVAMIQHRDVFLSDRLFMPGLSRDDLFAVMNAVFWKGDFVQCKAFEGATVKSALQQSQKFETQEGLGLTGDLSVGWSLAVQGVAQSARGQQSSASLVSGQLLDSKTLYGVAVTDFLAYGDTGYPTFPSGQPSPDRSLRLQHLLVLSDVIARNFLGAPVGNPLEAREFLDSLHPSHNPPPAPPKGTFGQWLRGMGKTSDEFRNVDPNDPEMEAQQRPFSSIDLYKADAGYSLFAHNGSEASIGTRFPGVSAFDVTQTNSASLTFDYIARIQKNYELWGLYGQSELNYGTKDQRKTDDSYTRSQTSNFLYQEFGYFRNFEPSHRNPSGWKFLAPISVQTQVQPPQLSIVFPTPPSGTSSAVATGTGACGAGYVVLNGKCVLATAEIVSGQHSYFLMGRPGFRYDYLFQKPATGTSSGSGAAGSGKGQGLPVQSQTYNTYLEFGYEAGPQLNGIEAFAFTENNQPVNTPAPCSIYGAIASCVYDTLSEKIPGLGVTSIPGRGHLQDGFYLNFRLDMPLPLYSKVEFVVENKGDFLVDRHAHDSVVDPFLSDDLKSSVLVPIWGKLSLAPTFEMQLFANKIAYNLYRSLSTSVSLNYSFDWRTGLHWRDVLGYDNPTPLLPDLPNR